MTERHEAYTAMLIRHHTLLWRMCWHHAHGDRDRCCDLMQEVSIALWLNFDKLRPGSQPRQEKAWVRWQARSVFYQIDRRQRLSAVPLDDVVAENLVADDPANRMEVLDHLLSVLDPDERGMMTLYLEGYRGDEIGERLNLSRDAVYQRIHRAMQKVRTVTLVILALMLTTAVAIAIVPQWRHAVFGRDEKEPDKVSPEVLPFAEPYDVDTPDAVAPVGISEPRVERLPDLDVVELIAQMTAESDTQPMEFQPLEMIPTLVVNGSRLIISGADGELIRIEDAQHRLIYYEVCRGVSVIDPFLFRNISVFGPDRYVLRVKIGRYPEVDLKM